MNEDRFSQTKVAPLTKENVEKFNAMTKKEQHEGLEEKETLSSEDDHDGSEDLESDGSDVSWDPNMRDIPESKLNEMRKERKKKKRDEKNTMSSGESEVESQPESEDTTGRPLAHIRKTAEKAKMAFLAELDAMENIMSSGY
jgi:hypothetical protein